MNCIRSYFRYPSAYSCRLLLERLAGKLQPRDPLFQMNHSTLSPFGDTEKGSMAWGMETKRHRLSSTMDQTTRQIMETYGGVGGGSHSFSSSSKRRFGKRKKKGLKRKKTRPRSASRVYELNPTGNAASSVAPNYYYGGQMRKRNALPHLLRGDTVRHRKPLTFRTSYASFHRFLSGFTPVLFLFCSVSPFASNTITLRHTIFLLCNGFLAHSTHFPFSLSFPRYFHSFAPLFP